MSRIIERELSDPEEGEQPQLEPDPDDDFDDKQFQRELPNHAEAPKRGRPKKKKEELVPEPPKQEEPPVDAVALAQKRTIAKRLMVELKATGTGLDIDTCRSLEQLDEEIAVLDASLNNRRGQKGMQKFVMFAVGLLEAIVSKNVPAETFDIGATSTSRHLTEEVADNWEMFDEVVQHLAIRHAAFFAVGPYATLGQSLAVCIHNVSSENMKRHIMNAGNKKEEKK